jgi:hypothetical protein
MKCEFSQAIVYLLSRFTGHYTNAFGSLDDMLAGRAVLVKLAEAAGVKVD